MVVIELTNVKDAGVQRGSPTRQGVIEAKVDRDCSKYVFVDEVNDILGIKWNDYSKHFYMDNATTFNSLHMGTYYLLTEEELKAICKGAKQEKKELPME